MDVKLKSSSVTVFSFFIFYFFLFILSLPRCIGEMQEWLNWLAWKAGIPQKGIRGSNPLLSADNQGGVNLKKDLHPLFYCLKSNICVLKSVEI